jgi:hypothetical protein
VSIFFWPAIHPADARKSITPPHAIHFSAKKPAADENQNYDHPAALSDLDLLFLWSEGSKKTFPTEIYFSGGLDIFFLIQNMFF